MDEPFSGIDVGSEAVLMKILGELKNQGKTVFIVHHDLNTSENYFDWGILLNMRLVAYGPLKEVFTPEYQSKTYGKSYALFDEALRLPQQKATGI